MTDYLEESYEDLRVNRKQKEGEIIKMYPYEDNHEGNAMKGLVYVIGGLFTVGFIGMMVWLIKHFLK